MPGYPENRLRRLRETDAIRNLTQETKLSVNDLIFPLFITHGKNVKTEKKPYSKRGGNN